MSSNKILPEEIVNIIENEGFSCNGKISKQSGEYYVEIFQGTPLGEDWNETFGLTVLKKVLLKQLEIEQIFLT